jgi:hypothetical protein
MTTLRPFISLFCGAGRRRLERRHDVETRDVRGLRERKRRHHHIGDVFGLHRGPPGIHRGASLVAEQRFVEIGFRAPGDDLRDANAVRRHIQAQPLSKCRNGRFRCAVDGEIGECDMARSRAGEEDVAVLALSHPGRHKAGQVDAGVQIDADDRVDRIDRCFIEGRQRRHDARVVDQYVDRLIPQAGCERGSIKNVDQRRHYVWGFRETR